MNGNVDDAVYSRAEVQDLINKNPGRAFMLCEQNSDTWQSPVEARFTVAAANKPKPPPPPAATAPQPQAAVLPTPSVMPSTPPPVVPAPQNTTASNPLSPEEMQEYNTLKVQFDAGTLPPNDLMKFVKYVHRVEKA